MINRLKCLRSAARLPIMRIFFKRFLHFECTSFYICCTSLQNFQNVSCARWGASTPQYTYKYNDSRSNAFIHMRMMHFYTHAFAIYIIFITEIWWLLVNTSVKLCLWQYDLSIYYCRIKLLYSSPTNKLHFRFACAAMIIILCIGWTTGRM